MKKKVLAPLAILSLSLVGILSFSLLRQQKKTPPPLAPELSPAPSPVPDGGSENGTKDVPTRPASAEEVKRCDAASPLGDASWPVERTWRIGRNIRAERDLCLATLTIHLKNGQTKVLTDSIIDPDEAMANDTYGISQYFKEEGYFAAYNSFMENGSLLLISDETGEETGLACSLPGFSPSRSSLFSICTTSDGEAATNSIGIWSKVGGVLKAVYAIDDLPWTPTNLKWVDDNTVVFEQVTAGSEDMEGESRVPARITRTGETWVMDPPLPPKTAP